MLYMHPSLLGPRPTLFHSTFITRIFHKFFPPRQIPSPPIVQYVWQTKLNWLYRVKQVLDWLIDWSIDLLTDWLMTWWLFWLILPMYVLLPSFRRNELRLLPLQEIDTSNVWLQLWIPQPSCTQSTRSVSDPKHCTLSSQICPDPGPYCTFSDWPVVLLFSSNNR